MTPPTTPTDSERTPRTRAGRYLLHAIDAQTFTGRTLEAIRDTILAIEAEAAALPERAGLDAEALSDDVLMTLDSAFGEDAPDWAYALAERARAALTAATTSTVTRRSVAAHEDDCPATSEGE